MYQAKEYPKMIYKKDFKYREDVEFAVVDSLEEEKEVCDEWGIEMKVAPPVVNVEQEGGESEGEEEKVEMKKGRLSPRRGRPRGR